MNFIPDGNGGLIPIIMDDGGPSPNTQHHSENPPALLVILTVIGSLLLAYCLGVFDKGDS